MQDVSFLGMLVYYWLMKIEAGTFFVNFCEEQTSPARSAESASFGREARRSDVLAWHEECSSVTFAKLGTLKSQSHSL